MANNKKNTTIRSTRDLLNSKTLQHYNDYIKHLTTFDIVHEANDLAKALDFLIKEQSSLPVADAKKYEIMAAKAKFISLNFLSNKEVVSLFENNLADALNEEDIILKDKVLTKLSTVFADDLDSFKRELREAMTRNRQRLTAVPIKVAEESKPPTISNWVKDYNSVVGAQIVSQIDRVNYLSNNKNVKRLSPEDKKKVEELINLYENLKLSSETHEGIEEAIPYYINGQHFILKKGKLEKIKPDKMLISMLSGKPEEEVEKEIEQQEAEDQAAFLSPELAQPAAVEDTKQAEVEKEILEAYQGNNKLQKAIAKEIKKLDKKFGSDKEALRAEFFQTTQKGNVNRTVGALMLMTQNDELLEFIGEDPKLNKFLAAIWEKQYGADLVADFKINPTNIKYVKMFLQYVLEQRLKMDENDAARVGLQIGNAFAALGKKSYNKMAYFDVKTKKFNWFE